MPRTKDQIAEQYVVEKELALRLRRTPASRRGEAYAVLYDELFRRVPHHPQLLRKASPEETARRLSEELRLLEPLLSPEATFLELGPGDCALSAAVAARVRRVIAVDVSAEITRRTDLPENLEVVLSDGRSVPVPPGSVHVAYSNQLMEHLHPEDAASQLEAVHRSLSPGGRYLCITPSRLNGPHDISKYFDVTATGLHLKEYTMGELTALFRKVGFGRLEAVALVKGTRLTLPPRVVQALEGLLAPLPRRMRTALAASRLLSVFLGIKLLAWKGEPASGPATGGR